MGDLMCPECTQGKPQNCAGQALDPVTDEFVPCLGACVITADGWCATHSGSDGPSYCPAGIGEAE